MGKATRTLAMAGMALIAGATVGAGPAMAATPSVQSVTVSTQVAVKAPVKAPAKVAQSRYRVVGYYRSYRSCDWAGRSGERRDRWDSYRCERVGSGHRRGAWALVVRWGGHGGGHGGGGHNGGGHGGGGHNGGGHGGGGHNGGGHGRGHR